MDVVVSRTFYLQRTSAIYRWMNNYLDVGISIGRTRRRKPMNTISKREEHRSQERKEPSVERKEETSDVYKKRENRRTKGKMSIETTWT